MAQKDKCGMVYYWPLNGSFYFVHRSGDAYLVVHRYECGKTLHNVEDIAWPTRAEAQAALDLIATQHNMIREPQHAGRWA